MARNSPIAPLYWPCKLHTDIQTKHLYFIPLFKPGPLLTPEKQSSVESLIRSPIQDLEVVLLDTVLFCQITLVLGSLLRCPSLWCPHPSHSLSTELSQPLASMMSFHLAHLSTYFYFFVRFLNCMHKGSSAH